MGAENLFAQYLKPARTVQDYSADLDRRDLMRLNLEGQRGQNALLAVTRQQQMDQAQQAMAERAAIRAAAQASGGDREKFLAALDATGLQGPMKLADEQRTAALGRQKTQAEIGHIGGQTAAQNATAAKTMEEARYAAALHHAQGLAYVQTPQDVVTYIDQGISKGVFPAELRGQMVDNLKQYPTLEAWKSAQAQAAIPIVEKFKVDAENSRNAATNATSRSNNAATVGATMRGQNMTDARMRDSLNQKMVEMIAESGGPSQAALVKQFGKSRPGFRWKQDGSLEAIPGGDADQKSQLKMAGESTVDGVVAELRDKYDQLEKSGGITSTKNGVLSNAGAWAGTTGVGQATGRMLGTQNQSLRNAVSMARPLLLQAIMRATGMSAKQMDSNAELKLWLATATDPTLDVQANKDALDRIERLYGSGSSAAPKNPTPTPAPTEGWTYVGPARK